MSTLLLNSYVHLSHPFTSKKLRESEEIPKKMRNFVGSIDCVDKLKLALRQSLKQ